MLRTLFAISDKVVNVFSIIIACTSEHVSCTATFIATAPPSDLPCKIILFGSTSGLLLRYLTADIPSLYKPKV